MSTSPSQLGPSRQNSLASNQQDIAAHLLEAAAQASATQESSGESEPEASPDGYKGDSVRLEKRRKRARACVACRNMKIRCNPVEGQEACLACSKVNRECVVPGPAKKRQKTVHKVAELEKKINALTQSLLAKNQAGPTPQQSPAITDGSQSTKEPMQRSPETQSQPLFPKSLIPPPRQQPVDPDYEDVIDRGIISFAMADRIFDKFVMEMNPLCPLVAFQPSTTLESVRRQRPMLCLAILASGAPSLLPEVYEELAEELARQLGHRMYFVFERSIDLVQASLIHTTWVGKHKSAKDLGFNQYIHGAVVMAHDLGLSKRLKTPLTKDAAEEAEMRRTWLSCYYCALFVSCTLRHPPMVRTTPYVQDCLKFFAKSPAALPTDAVLCSMIRLVQIMEDVACSFHMDDPASVVHLEDSSTQYSLKLFERRIEDWHLEASRHMEPKLLNLLLATATIYSHEIALHTDHNVDDFRPPGQPGSAETPSPVKDFITPSHLDALTKAVVAMRSVLDTFISLFPSSEVRALPCLYIVWAAYAAVAMIRLDGALRSSKSRYAEVFLPDLKIEYYLDLIIERLSRGKLEASATGSPRPMFVHAFQKLRLWHQYRLVGVVAPDFADSDNPRIGMGNIKNKMDDFAASKERLSPNTSNSITKSDGGVGNVENSMIGAGPAEMLRLQREREELAGALGQNGAKPNAHGFDAHGGSWLTNSSMPIDTSLFENQDWNFTLEDWNNFEASMVQPAGGSWLGYLL